jgi:hypothetical protein
LKLFQNTSEEILVRFNKIIPTEVTLTFEEPQPPWDSIWHDDPTLGRLDKVGLTRQTFSFLVPDRAKEMQGALMDLQRVESFLRVV